MEERTNNDSKEIIRLKAEIKRLRIMNRFLLAYVILSIIIMLYNTRA
jgi:hypothetical protein